MADQDIIEVNGKQYNTVTGRVVPREGEGHIAVPVRRTIDGVIGTVRPHIKAHPIAPRAIREQQHTKTLLRTAVKKPPDTKPLLSMELNKARRERLANLVERDIKPKIADSALLEKAKEIRRSDFVKKFGTPLAEKLNVKGPGINTPQTPDQPGIAGVHQKRLEQLAQIEKDPDEQAFTDAAVELSETYKPLARPRPTRLKKMADRLHMSVRTMLVSGVALLVVAGGAFSIYHYYYNLVVYYDGVRMHFHGDLPGQTIPGFSISGIAARDQTLTINYASNSDSRAYSISEQPTNWDSEAILSSVVIPAVGNNYQTSQIGGRTVYMYKQTSVWVDGGVYFRLTYNSANLSNDQLSSVINSL